MLLPRPVASICSTSCLLESLAVFLRSSGVIEDFADSYTDGSEELFLPGVEEFPSVSGGHFGS